MERIGDGPYSYPMRSLWALSSPRNAGFFGDVSAFDRTRQTKMGSSPRLRDTMENRVVHVIERACVAEVMTCFEWRFVETNKSTGCSLGGCHK